MSKINQSGEFLGALTDKFLDPLMKVAAHLAKNALAPLATTTSYPLIDTVIQRKMRGQSCKAR